MKKLILLLPLCIVSGCAILEHGEEMQTLGETAEQIGAATMAFQPQIGFWILMVGGIAVAVGKLLKGIK